ncbi:VanZ-like protein [Gottschalkia acidurici 9a]|uniref:VanZ-like protein n=1 Tax=Gottschalkia acidurici (strain ATCC 7906 / DSM 604 / BCRC 14475 / CIP 104303 / KCTC 5404 / NCIMB 10678 / 9a) TaxID=1128398 RepID=K0B3Q4_GOTA9|nr:VanZ family protein [Gottschalkia acidurici]AFS79777.1 VanZ-like protein [Gottschalkia acidurici 9a]
MPKCRYHLGYFFILYLNITLKITLRFNNPIFNPNINLIPLKYGFGIENILNIVLFMPLGFLLPILWEKYRNFWSTFYYGLFFSLFIEIGQLFVRNRATDINDLIMNTIGAIVGWVIFNALRKVSRKFSTKTAINISSNDTLAIKLESCVYVVITIICLF